LFLYTYSGDGSLLIPSFFARLTGDNMCQLGLVAHAVRSQAVGIGNQLRLYMCVSVCLRVRALKGKRLDLSTPTSVDVMLHGMH